MDEKDLKNLVDREIEKTVKGSSYYILNKFSKEFITEYKNKCNNNLNEIEVKKNNEIKILKETTIAEPPKPLKPIKPKKFEFKTFTALSFLVGIIFTFSGIAIDVIIITFFGLMVSGISFVWLSEEFTAYKQYNEEVKKYEKDLFEYNPKMDEYNQKIVEYNYSAQKKDEQLNEIEEKYNLELAKNKELLKRLERIEDKNKKILTNFRANLAVAYDMSNLKYDSNKFPVEYRNLSSVIILNSYFENELVSNIDEAFNLYKENGELIKSVKELNQNLLELKQKFSQVYIVLNTINNKVDNVESILNKMKIALEGESFPPSMIDNFYSEIAKECDLIVV